ncbi:Integral membrane protein OS=Streptomyces alboniger OX=132473 GN=CP975_16600 PE=4 SV=1 [Streptomyces alboniger]
MLAPSQAQANDFSDWSCTNIPFADKVCSVVESTNKAIDFASDPLGYIAQFFNNAVTSIFTQMMKALGSTTRIDWRDPGFLRTYTMAFAASTVLTVIYWLIAVAKRAIQGVPPLQALAESIGFLLMSVLVSAFAPLAIAYTVRIVDEAAEAMLKPVAGDAADMVVTVTTAMLALMTIPGGAIIVIFFALALLAAVAGVWLELIVRNALILSGLGFGPTVFSGLVDRDLWGHTKRWFGVMAAIIASNM